jgi:hypothetical protein
MHRENATSPGKCGKLAFIALACGLGLADSQFAFANNLTLTITQTGSSPASISDNGPGDTSSTPGTIVWQESGVGGISVAQITGGSNSPGTPAVGSLFDVQTDIRNNTASPFTLTAALSDSGFSAPVGTRSLLSDITVTFVTSGVGDSVTFQSTANSTSTPLQTLTASGSDSKTVSFNGLVPYSLSSITTATLSPGAEVLISDSTSVVPEPAAATTLGLFAIGLLARRRRK